MKHPRKEGKVISDKDVKFIKKLLKKNPIILEGKIYQTDDCIVEVTNIRKYNNCWFIVSNTKFVYEIDVKVKKNEISRWRPYYFNSTSRINQRVRSWSLKKLLLEELCYFNVEDFCISKISYE
jgi:hypothetical protein